jgi:hypothetical protein
MGLQAVPPGFQQLLLQAEHLGVLLRFCVVIAQEMQYAVHGEQLKFRLRAVPGRLCLLGRDLRAEHNVAEQAGVGGRLLAPAGLRRPELVHRERQHVRRARLPHPALVQLGHRLLIDNEHGQLRQRVDPQLIQRVPGHRGEPGLVDLHAGLIRDIDAHLRLVFLWLVCWPLCAASCFSYASTIFPTSRCLTTSWLVSLAK